MKKEIQLTAEFRAQATRAIFAIVFFALTYLLILAAAIVLAGLCMAGGVFIIAARPMFLTLVIGIGLSGLGVMVFLFLVKFIFKSHKVDRSHLTEISRADEPELFKMIDEIVNEVRTSQPKKVYLSADVNASVFYDSSFWSMILPIKKNLNVGIGLVNTVTAQELKAILSHEFGHFSQRSMKVGTYVYNVNQVIFNMLYDNGSFESMIQRWANMSGWFSIFAMLTIKIVQGIQEILRGLYGIVNKSYMALSREMEFNADEIAASVTGYQPLKSSLMRMQLADMSYNKVLDFYNGKISENIKSENIYRDQTSVLNFLAERNKFPLTYGLPTISQEEQSKFDKSKLVIKDQWSSHPTTEERVKRLEQLNSSLPGQTDKHANYIFKNIEETQKLVTNKLFEQVTYK